MLLHYDSHPHNSALLGPFIRPFLRPRESIPASHHNVIIREGSDRSCSDLQCLEGGVEGRRCQGRSEEGGECIANHELCVEIDESCIKTNVV